MVELNRVKGKWELQRNNCIPVIWGMGEKKLLEGGNQVRGYALPSLLRLEASFRFQLFVMKLGPVNWRRTFVLWNVFTVVWELSIQDSSQTFCNIFIFKQLTETPMNNSFNLRYFLTVFNSRWWIWQPNKKLTANQKLELQISFTCPVF